MASEEPEEYSSILQLVLTVLGTVTAMIILIVGITMASKYGPQPQHQPLIIKIHAFSVSGLNVSNLLMATNWDITLLFANQNSELEVAIDRFRSLLYYNYTYNDPISCAVTKAIHLGPKKQRVVQMKFNSTQCGEEQPFLDEKVLEGIKEDEIKGEMSFGIGMKLMVSYRTGILGWDYELKPDCPKVHIGIESGTGNGGVIFDQPKECLVPLRD
ncbi:hypothetical protein COLO4_29585 [Corchorus olitorius]|uniref:Late embryogenesis abundant protein, LEA-14 n=1 Tax=Corchorus olitorius TaxID=93759 RepID=A0A1R3HE17_9ROSI|nr:hypothetical protein COLO4_29585 [Corchorus olitorius]